MRAAPIDKPGSARGASGSAWERLGALKVYALATPPRRAALPARARGGDSYVRAGRCSHRRAAAIVVQARGGPTHTSARGDTVHTRGGDSRTPARRPGPCRGALKGQTSGAFQSVFSPPSRLPVIPARLPARLFPARLFARFLPVFPPAFPAVLAPFFAARLLPGRWVPPACLPARFPTRARRGKTAAKRHTFHCFQKLFRFWTARFGPVSRARNRAR